jgi:hypothetical protein
MAETARLGTSRPSTPQIRVIASGCLSCITIETFHPILADMTTLHA